MRLLLIIHFVFAIYSFAAGTVINSFSIPEMGGYPPRGLAYDATTDSYWVTCNFGPGNVKAYRFTYDGVSPLVEETINIDQDFYWSMDIAVSDYLFVNSDLVPDLVVSDIADFYHIDKNSGAIINSFSGPFAIGEHLNGSAFNGSSLYLSSYDSSTIYEVEIGGTVISSFSHDSTANNGLAWGGTTLADEGLWVVSGPPYNTVTKYISDSAVDQWFINLNNEYIAGACWGVSANESLLISTFSGSKLIYEVSFAPAGVKSASLGEIKAIYR